MASVTSTTTPTLRVNAAKGVEDKQQPHASRIQPPEGSASYDHFFWTYTEEPHRSRRQAIIKAHPEVCSIPPFSPQYGCLATTEEIQFANHTLLREGYKTMRPRTPYEMARSCRRLSPNHLRILAP
jgi:hypothetical protein